MRILLNYIVFLIFISLSFDGIAQITAEEPMPLPPFHIVTDFNKDGVEDLVYKVNDTIKVVTRIGLTTTALHQQYLNNAGSISVGDVDGDGYPEVLLTNYRFLRFIQNNNGFMGETIIVDTSYLPKEWAEVYDYDLDGDGDIVSYVGYGLYLFKNDQGTFDTDINAFIGTTKDEADAHLQYCDYNQDGSLDILLYCEQQGMFITTNQANGNFYIDNLTHFARYPESFDVGDFNQDGYPDIAQIYRNEWTDEYGILRIRLNGTFACCPSYFADSLGYQNAMEIVDLDQDGVAEVVAADRQSISVFRLINGILVREDIWGTQDTVETEPAIMLTIEDYDGDGKYEILHAEAGGEARMFRTDYVKSGEKYSCSQKADPQHCPPGHVTISSQQESDNFKMLYPDCTVLNNGLTVSGPISDLTGISNVKLLNGSFILENTILDTIQKLNLDFVNGDVIVRNNPEVMHIEMDSLRTIAGHLVVQGHPQITSLNTFNKLAACSSIEITDHALLKVIKGFDAYNPYVEDVYIRNNPELDTLRGFDNVNADFLLDASPVISVYIDADTFHIRNSAYTDLKPFLFSRAEKFILENISSLNLIEGLSTQPAWRITAINCDQVTGIGNAMRIKDLELRENDAFVDISKWRPPEDMERLVLIGNKALTHLNDFPAIRRIVYKVQIEDNPNLQDISGLQPMLATRPDSLVISHNPKLASCNTDFVCAYIEDGGSYRIKNNAPGCESLEHVILACEMVPPFDDDDDDDGGIIVLPEPDTQKINFNGDDAPVVRNRVSTSNEKIKLVPNPASTSVSCVSHIVPSFMMLYAPDGRFVKKVHQERAMDLANLSPGMYFMYIVTGTEFQCLKLYVNSN